MSIITLNTRSLPDSAVTTAKIAADAVTDAKVADDIIGTEHLTAGEVDATALGADSVTAAKINNDIISGSTELASEPADTDEFLVSDAGTLKRIDYSLIKGGGGSFEFVSRNAVGGSAVASIVINNLSTSGENYFLMWNGIDTVAGSSEDMLIQISSDNGSSFITSGYKSACFQFYSDGGEDSFSSSSGFVISENQVNNGTNEGNSGFAYLYNLESGQKAMMVGQNVVVGDSNRVRANTFGGMYDDGDAAYNAIRFIAESGNISANTKGFISLYKQIIS